MKWLFYGLALGFFVWASLVEWDHMSKYLAIGLNAAALISTFVAHQIQGGKDAIIQQKKSTHRNGGG